MSSFDWFQNQPKSKNQESKDERIYGIFSGGGSGIGNNDGDYNDYDTSKLSGSTLTKNIFSNKGYFGFVKSDKLLHNPTTTQGIKVHYGSKEQQQQEEDKKGKNIGKKVSFNEEVNKVHMFEKTYEQGVNDDTRDFIGESSDEENLNVEEEAKKADKALTRKLKTFDFKSRKYYKKEEDVDMQSYNLPTSFARVIEKKLQVNTTYDKETKEEMSAEHQHMEAQYGIGFKMLKKVGFEVGKGLGKNKQGIVAPLTGVKKTILTGQGNAKRDFEALFAGSDKNKEKEEDFIGLEEEDIGLIEKKKGKEKREEKYWKKNKQYLKRTTRHNLEKVGGYERKETESEDVKPILNQKVIDMRGPSVVYYDDYSLIKETIKPEATKDTMMIPKNSFIGELKLSIKGQIDKARYIMKVNDKKIKHEKDKIVQLDYENKKLKKDQTNATISMDILKKLKESINHIEESNGTLSLSEILDISSELLVIGPEEFIEYEIYKYLWHHIIKETNAEFKKWQITASTISYGYTMLEKVKIHISDIFLVKKKLLLKSVSSPLSLDPDEEKNINSIMADIVNKTWLNPVKDFIMKSWDPKEKELLLVDLIETWQDIIPKESLQYMYDMFLMPRLQKAVDEWNPIQEKVMIHLWIHPWFSLLGEQRILTLWKVIKLKLSSILQEWNPQDRSGFYILSPWLRALDKSHWENLVLRVILPKLLMTLRELEINPQNQNLQPFRSFMLWHEFIPKEHSMSLIETYILKKISETLDKWLKMPEFNKEEMKNWLAGWQNLFKQQIGEQKEISHFFDLMFMKANKKGMN